MYKILPRATQSMISLSVRLTLILSEWSCPLLDVYTWVSKKLWVSMGKRDRSIQYPQSLLVYACVCEAVQLCMLTNEHRRVRLRLCVCVRACGGMLNALDHPQTLKTCFDFPLHGGRESNPLRIPPLEVFSCHKPLFNRQNPTWALYSLLALLDGWGGEKA